MTSRMLFPQDLATAIEEYLEDCRHRHLASKTVKAYRRVLGKMRDYVGPAICVADLREGMLRNYRSTRNVEPGTSRIELNYMRTFCAWCVVRDWLDHNPAKKLKPPKQTQPPTMPYSEEEVVKLLAALDRFGDTQHNPAVREFGKIRARAIVMVLLHTGLRISDAAALRVDQVKDGRLYLPTTQKTGATVNMPLHRDAIAALAALTPVDGRYFPSANAIRATRRAIAKLGKMVGVHAHPHRFRDTFACRLLTAGADIRTVSLLLGHTSIKTTEKHYATFVAAHQKRPDEAVSRLLPPKEGN